MAYAEPADLAKLLGFDEVLTMTTAETARAQLLLDLATGEIDSVLGQNLAAGQDDVVIDGSGTRKLLLPRWPVNAITSVAEVDPCDGTETTLTFRTDYRWSRAGILTRVCGVWPCDPQSVHVVYDPGYDPVPVEVRSICLAVASRGWVNPAGEAQERLGDYAVTHVAGAELTLGEKSRLHRALL